MTRQFVEFHRRYYLPVNFIMDFKLGPSTLLASKETVHGDKDHVWHMTTLARLCQDSLLILNQLVIRFEDRMPIS